MVAFQYKLVRQVVERNIIRPVPCTDQRDQDPDRGPGHPAAQVEAREQGQHRGQRRRVGQGAGEGLQGAGLPGHLPLVGGQRQGDLAEAHPEADHPDDDAAHEQEDPFVVQDEFLDQFEGQQADAGIDHVAHRGAQADHQAGLAPVAQGPLDHHHQDGAEGYGGDHADQQSSQYLHIIYKDNK